MSGILIPATAVSLQFPIKSYRKTSLTGRKFCRASVKAAPLPAIDTCQPPVSLYEVLRVKKNASAMEIKAAYRNLAKVYHPDLRTNSSDGRDFIQLHKAYVTLSDPKARAVHDLTLAVGSRRRPVWCTAGAGDGSGVYRTQRWETDQCW